MYSSARIESLTFARACTTRSTASRLPSGVSNSPSRRAPRVRNSTKSRRSSASTAWNASAPKVRTNESGSAPSGRFTA